MGRRLCSSFVSTSSKMSTTSLCVHTVPTLDEVLSRTASHPYTLESFKKFAAEKHCQESLGFMAAVHEYDQGYRRLAGQPGGLQVDSHAGDLYTEWQELYRIYICPCAPLEINLDGKMRKWLLEQRDLEYVVLPNPTLFVPAVEYLSELMRGVFVQWITAMHNPPRIRITKTET